MTRGKLVRRWMLGALAAALALGTGAASAQPRRQLSKNYYTYTDYRQNACTGEFLGCEIAQKTTCFVEQLPDGGYAQKCQRSAQGACTDVDVDWPYEPVEGGSSYTQRDQWRFEVACASFCDCAGSETVTERLVSRGSEPDLVYTVDYRYEIAPDANGFCQLTVARDVRETQCR